MSYMLLLMAIFSIPVLRRLFFPRVDFAFGNGKHRSARMENIRHTVVLGLAINILASIIVAFAAMRL